MGMELVTYSMLSSLVTSDQTTKHGVGQLGTGRETEIFRSFTVCDKSFYQLLIVFKYMFEFQAHSVISKSV